MSSGRHSGAEEAERKRESMEHESERTGERLSEGSGSRTERETASGHMRVAWVPWTRVLHRLAKERSHENARRHASMAGAAGDGSADENRVEARVGEGGRHPPDRRGAAVMSRL